MWEIDPVVETSMGEWVTLTRVFDTAKIARILLSGSAAKLHHYQKLDKISG